MPVNQWLYARRRLLTSFLAATILPLAALAWLAWWIVEQDRALERQTVRDRIEREADLIVANLQRDLAVFEDDLVVSPKPNRILGNKTRDALIVLLHGDSLVAYPSGRLVYYPVSPSAHEPPADAFRSGEVLEFQRQDLGGAAVEFRRLASSGEAAVRAGALIRLGRALRKNHQLAEALVAYDQLAQMGDTLVGGAPSELVARERRATLFAEVNRKSDLAREAAALDSHLAQGRWRLDRATYLFYAGQVQDLLRMAGTKSAARDTALALAVAVQRLWGEAEQLRTADTTKHGRNTLWIDGLPLSILWKSSHDTLIALVAGPQFMRSSLERAWSRGGVSIALSDAEGRVLLGKAMTPPAQYALRSAQDSKLPWTLRVQSAHPGADLAQLALRRRLLLTALAATAVLTILGGGLIARATARELAVARLESDFVSAVSHEFRTPLTSLRHLTELLESGAVTNDDRRRQYYAVMARETARLHRMVEGLLDFGRMEAGKRDYSFESVTADQFVEEVVSDFGSEIESSGRRIERAPGATASSARRIRVDREAMSHAIRNLLDNAVKYSQKSSPVRVELEDMNGQVAIRVRDEGVGISADEQSTIFEKFVRGSASRTMNVKGTGVGLAMVRQIVGAHGGAVKVESQTGKGSTFTVVLPATNDNGVGGLE